MTGIGFSLGSLRSWVYRRSAGWRAFGLAGVCALALALGGCSDDLNAQPLKPVLNQPLRLNETSIAGPSLWSARALTPNASPLLYLAWTGDDPAQRLNVMLSRDGTTWSNKVVLGEESFAAPSVASDGKIVALAWVGRDAGYSINVMSDVYGAQRRLTLAECSPFAPALTYFDGQFWLAWAGCDATHALNVRPLGADGVSPGPGALLAKYTSRTAPDLIADPQNGRMLLAWTEDGANLANEPQGSTLDIISMLTSTDGAHWSDSQTTPMTQHSSATPRGLALASPPSGTPSYFLTWAGTDGWHSLNLNTTDNAQTWAAAPVTFQQQCYGGPAVGWLGVARQVTLAWTGIDPYHHLNIAQVGL